MAAQTAFDVLVCGGGLAGLTLARHIRLELPELSVAVVERTPRPLPDAAYKVGESSIELATYYYTQVLRLDSYFRRRHLPKLGLRFFFGDARGPLEARPETGQSVFPPVPSLQIDRGRLETDLRQLVIEMGVTLLEGVSIEAVDLAEGDAPHIVHCRPKGGGAPFTLAGRWLADASGRRRLLQTRLGLKRSNGHQASAAWWRYTGRVDVDDIPARGRGGWRERLVEDRYYSTNHLMGRGYWVWLIPLGTGATSVGIVTDETIHPQATYGKSYAQSLEWLQAHEPVLWEFLRELTPLDFISFKNYSYASAQLFSHQRWCCVGEAGFFLDPLYSIGGDFIAITNTLSVELIRRERQGTLTEAAVDGLNRLVLDNLYQICLGFYRGAYRGFGHAQIFTPKLAWDTGVYWAWMYQLFVQGLLLEPAAEVLALGQRYRELNDRVQRLFVDWSDKAPPRSLFVRGDMTRMRFWQLLHLDLAARRSPAQALEVARRNLDRFEELAQVLFWQAMSECYPGHPAIQSRPWINAWRMVLDPGQWAAEGTLDSDTAPRPLRASRDNFTGLFAPQSLREYLVYELPYQMLHWGRGFFYYHVVPLIRRLIWLNRPALWVRRFLVPDYPA